VEYVLTVLLLGIGFGEILNAWKPEDDLASRTGIALGIGMAVSGLFLFVLTSGFAIFGHVLIGVGDTAAYALLAAGLVAILVPVAVRRRFSFPRKLAWGDSVIAALVVVQGAMLLQYFSQFPYFQEFPSADFTFYYAIPRDIISGTPSFPAGILYYGPHLQIVLSMLFEGVLLEVARYTAATLAVFSTPLFYVATLRLLKNRTAALAGTAIYTLSATVWFGNLFNAGLYSQFYGIMAILFFVAAMVPLVESPRRLSSWLLLLVAVANAYIAHYSVLLLVPVLCVMPLLALATKGSWKAWLLPLGLFLVPLVLGVALYPGMTSLLVGFLNNNSPNSAVGTTQLASFLSSFPVVSYMVLDVTNDPGAVILLALAVLSVLALRKAKVPTDFFPLIFVGVVVLGSPFNALAWRFSFDAIVFLTMMAGVGMALLVPSDSRRRRMVAGLAIAVLCVSGMVYGSWGQQMVTPVPQSAQYQSYVYNAILWIKDNTPQNAVYYSVTDWRFNTIGLWLQRPANYGFSSNLTTAFASATEQQIDHAAPSGTNGTYVLPPSYMIITDFVTENLPPDPSLYPWNTFTSNPNMTLVYSSPDVKIFQMTTITACRVAFSQELNASVTFCPPQT